MMINNWNEIAKINKIIIIFSIVLFLLSSIGKLAGFPLFDYLALNPKLLTSGFISQILTFSFVDLSPITLIFNLLIIAMIGQDLSLRWGTKIYQLFILCSIAGSVILALVLSMIYHPFMNMKLYGLNGISSSLLLAYAIIFPDRQLSFMMIFPLKARYFCILMIALEFYFAIFSSSGLLSVSHLGAMLGGYSYLVFTSKKSKGKGGSSFNRKKGKLSLVNPSNSSQISENGPEPLDKKKDPRYFH
jgi:membrane associated rhomboid family serine protease